MAPENMGYRVSYRPGAVNYCPACSHAQWYVGRSSAECAFCNAVVPLAAPVTWDQTYRLAS